MDAITEKLKQLHNDKKNIKELRSYLETLDWEKIESLLNEKLMTSSGLELLDTLFNGFSNSNAGHEKKFKAIKHVIKLMQKSEIISQISLIVTSIRLELPNLCGNHLKIIAEDCLESIRDNSDPYTIWKDILPECLSVLNEISGKIIHNDTEMTGPQYVGQCIQSICLIKWDPSIVTPLATMFRDLTLSKEDHLQIVKKLCCDLDGLNPEALPPLLYQLLRLCREQNSTVVFFKFSEYFAPRLYPELYPKNAAQESESPDLDLIGAEQPNECALSAHATCIQFAVGDSCIPRQMLSTLKTAARRPSTLLSSPPLLHLLLSADSQRDICIQIVKSTLTYSLLERQKREELSWCCDALPLEVPLEILIKSLVESSTKHCHLSTVGLLHLSTSLITSWGNVPLHILPAPYIHLRALGRLLFVRLGRACPNSIGQGLKMMMHTPQLLTDLLESLCINAGPMLMECIPELRTIVEECLCVQHDRSEGDTVSWRCRILQSVVPLTTRASNLRDTFLIMCRKGLFSRDPSVGRVAVTGLLSLLKALRCSSDTFSQDFSSSEHSVLTQISIDVHSNNTRSRVNNTAVCLEIISQLRVCLNQSWEVKEQLYQGLPSVLFKRVELLTPLQELLYEHLTLKFINSQSTIPLSMEKCVSTRDDGATLLEPIGALLFCLQKITVSDLQDSSTDISENAVSSNKLIKLLQSLAEKFANKTPVDFGLDDGIWISDILPESKSRYLVVQQLLQVLEAMIAFCLQHWAFLENGTASKTIQGLHKTHGQLTDFVKINSKVKKNDKNISMRRSQKSQKDTTDKEEEKTKGKRKKGPMKLTEMRKDHAIVFKPLDTVWDIDTVFKIVQLLYSDNMEWTSKEEMTNLRTSRTLHRHFMKSCINAVKTTCKPSHIGQIIRVAKVIYTHCLSRLDDFSDFDQETTLHVVECFNELISIVCNSENNEKLLTFLKEVGGETELTDLSSRISVFCDTIAKQVIKTAEGCTDNEDPSAAKIPPALLKLLTTILAKVPSNTPACDKWTEWLIQLCSDGTKSKWVGSSVIPTILSLSARSRNPWNAVEALVEALTKIMKVDDDTEEDVNETYSGLFSCLAHSSAACNATFLALCAHLNRRLGATELVCARLKSEQAILPYKAHTIALALKNRERSLCNELTHLVNVCKCVAALACPAGTCCTASVKVMCRLHSVLSLTAQHFITRDVTFLLHARFDRVVMTAGRRLSKSCDNLIEYVGGARREQKEGRSVVVKDTKHIPRMVYLMEQFVKRIMQLDKKTKLDLMSHMSKGTARDFRIKASTIHNALMKQNNDGEEDEEEEQNDGDERSIVEEVENAIQEEFGNSDDDGTSKRDSDEESSTTNAASDNDDDERPKKKKRTS